MPPIVDLLHFGVRIAKNDPRMTKNASLNVRLESNPENPHLLHSQKSSYVRPFHSAISQNDD